MIFLAIILSAVLTNNFLTVKTYGVCPFLGVSKKTSGALGMGVAVTVVMALATAVTYPIYNWVMVAYDARGNEIYNFQFLEIIFFIFIIASLVQMLEKIIQKVSPSLYKSMGVYLPLITTNCAVLGVCELVKDDSLAQTLARLGVAGFEMSYGWAVLYAAFAGVGFTLVMVIMSGIRERIELYKTPKALSGFPLAMICASFICMAFMVFSFISL